MSQKQRVNSWRISLIKFAVASTIGLSPLVQAETYWTDLQSDSRVYAQLATESMPEQYRVVLIDVATLQKNLTGVIAKASNVQTVISLPQPDGSSRDFMVKPSGVLPEALARKFPEITAFQGFAIDDPTVTVRAEISHRGLSAQVLEPGKRWMIDPKPGVQKGLAISYYSGDTKRPQGAGMCELESERSAPLKKNREKPAVKKLLAVESKPAAKSSGTSLRTYRLAVATTGEYGQFHGGQTATALAAVVTTINRVTGILEKEMSISLQLVANNDLIIYTDALTDPFTGNDDASTLIDESQTQIDLVIGDENYDIGHTFSTGAGGLASLPSVCVTGRKAKGVTGSSVPRGDFFDVDYVAHEIGHQFGGNHTFNGSNGGCDSNRWYLAAYEPGSGSTIQAYPGLCGPDNLQGAVDPIYHSYSFDEMYGYAYEEFGSSCGVQTSTSNTPPTVDAGSDYAVPKGTPLVVSGSGSDSEQSAITYLWEQHDLGAQVPLSAADDGEIPLFRVLTPSTNPTRHLPKLSSVVSGNYSNDEKIPQVARELDMRLTVRDGVGGVASDDMVISVNGAAGPFEITSPNGGEMVGGSKTVRWDVAGTNASPINTSQVEILLSTNGGLSFSTSLGTTSNDGTHTINFPAGIKSTSARLMIKAVGNIYYDVSDENFDLDSDRIVPSAPVQASVTSTDGGAVVSFSPGEDNGVPITSYVASCSAPDTSEVTSSSTSPAQPFDENSPYSSLLVFQNEVTIQESGLQVPVDISHSYRGDVILELSSPAGTSVSLKTNNGSDSGVDVVGTFPTTLAPVESLNNFAGESAKGTWTLSVSDAYNDDSGTVNSWGITVVSVISGDVVSRSGSGSPLVFTGLTNDVLYQCEITAYSGSDVSDTVVIGGVTPQSSGSADTDGDGVPDTEDAFPNDASETTDSDSDGVGDNADAFPNDASETLDSDLDGVGDNADAFPNDASESADTDSDGVGDNADAFPNDASETLDSDSDGVGDNADVFPNDGSESADSDSDGVGDNADAFPNDASETLDSDSDGVGDNADVFPNDASESADSDSDGVGDNADAFPNDASESSDSDLDGVGDNTDAFPTDANETIDTDDDGVGDNADLYPLDSTKQFNTPYVVTFEGVVDFVTESAADKEPHRISAGDQYRYTLVLDNHGNSSQDQQWSRSDIEFLMLTIEDQDFAAALIDVPNIRTAFGFGSSLSSLQGDVGLSVATDASGALSKTFNDTFFLGTSSDTQQDWYQTFGWLDSEVMVTLRLQARTDTVAEAVGPYSDQSAWGFTGINHSARIEDSQQWNVVSPAVCNGPLILDSQADVDAMLDNVCSRVAGDLLIRGDQINDLSPLRILRTVDGRLFLLSDLTVPTLNGLQGVSHINGEQVVDSDGDHHPDFMDTYPNDSAAAFDTDGDGLPNAWLPGFFASSVNPDLSVDNDDDNDGVLDWEDDFPLDPNEAIDSDNDGIGNNTDTDDDDDGVSDVLDAFPLNPLVSADTDEDGAPDAWSDGVTEDQIAASALALDAFPLEPAASVDSDEDGFPDVWNAGATQTQIAESDLVLDAFPNDATESIDTDSDGQGNNSDLDDDGDGYSDVEELEAGTSPVDASDIPSTGSRILFYIRAIESVFN